MIYKRYQYYGKQGIEWTPWFLITGKEIPKYQLKPNLRNEYKETKDISQE
jgi:hypothetical protein